MDHALICNWLGLPPDAWPPDYYALLGLAKGEPDVTLIEQHVHDCLARLRPYQLNHPDQVTEAMNRLAQAFPCLTDPESKEAYDVALKSPTSARAEAVEVVPPPAEAAEAAQTQTAAPAEASDPLAWLFGPWNKAVTEAPPAQV